MAENAERFFVLTGGPGAGKSTLADAVQQAGFSRSLEAGRGIIQDQVSIGGLAVPWNNRALFAELMLCWEIRSFRMAEQQKGPVFFDRAVPDVAGYLRLSKLPVPAHFEKAAETFRYNRRVFIAPPGGKSSSRTASASRISTKRSEPTRRWWKPTKRSGMN